MIEKLYKVKPLEWVDFQYGSEADTPFGRYTVELPFPGFKRSPYWLDLDDNHTNCASLEAGKAACEAHWRAKLAEVLEEVPEEWQPIETAPKDGTNILVWCPERNRVYLVYWDEFADDWFAFTDRWISKVVSHWMPVPKPPAGGPKEGK